MRRNVTMRYKYQWSLAEGIINANGLMERNQLHHRAPIYWLEEGFTETLIYRYLWTKVAEKQFDLLNLLICSSVKVIEKHST